MKADESASIGGADCTCQSYGSLSASMKLLVALALPARASPAAHSGPCPSVDSSSLAMRLPMGPKGPEDPPAAKTAGLLIS
eukprot:11189152-Lingulodinium_polyedra.AAC.1